MLYTKPADCCGCTACMNVCPKNAITMKPDGKGFLYPYIDQTKCMNCGLCRKVCPLKEHSQTGEYLTHPDVYAVKNVSDSVRMQSSSGGIFTAVSGHILELGGTVYGAAFDSTFRVCHRRAVTKEERDFFRGSKYVQSDLENTFAEVKEDLVSGMPVLFSGTPCQAAGLRSFLKQSRAGMEELYLCDLVCHGTPSPKIFKDYLNRIIMKYGSEIESITFRYKLSGWRAQALSIAFDNGRAYQSAAPDDPYYRLFLQNIILRDSCYHCLFASPHRPADLTFGDFWGIEKHMPGFDDEKGVSLVLVNTEKGRQLFQAVRNQLDIRTSWLEQAMQRNLQKPSAPSPKTFAFWDDYQKRGFEFVVKKYGGAGIIGEFKSGIKKALILLGLFDTVKRVIRRK